MTVRRAGFWKQSIDVRLFRTTHMNYNERKQVLVRSFREVGGWTIRITVVITLTKCTTARVPRTRRTAPGDVRLFRTTGLIEHYQKRRFRMVNPRP